MERLQIDPLWLREWRKADQDFEKTSAQFDNLEQVLDYMKKIDYHPVIQYHNADDDWRRSIFQSLYSELGIDFKGKSLLDIGPGYGDSLELAQEGGASRIEFIDYDPFIVIFLRLKGFPGYRFDYFQDGFQSLEGNKYDVILSKGSINADRFNRHEFPFLFDEWLDQLESLTRSEIIICPTFDKGTTKIGNAYHLCEKPEEFRNSEFFSVLQEKGYNTLCIEGFNVPVERFPFTFYKKLD